MARGQKPHQAAAWVDDVILRRVVLAKHHHLVLEPQADGDGAPQHAAHALGVGYGLAPEPLVVEDRRLSLLVCDVDGLRRRKKIRLLLCALAVKDGGVEHGHDFSGGDRKGTISGG